MKTSLVVAIAGLAASTGAGLPPGGTHHPTRRPLIERIVPNDNRRPAGALADAKLELKLDIVNARWFPEADNGPSVMMQAFAEEGRAPEIPGPMIRVRQGTEIHITLHNSLDSEVVVHGLHTRPALSDDIVSVPARGTRDVSFQAGAAGTYFYWGTSTGKSMFFRVGEDSQLTGAIIVDPIEGAPSSDRTFVIGLYSEDKDSAAGRSPHPREITVMNGKSWPYTEQFTFKVGDTVSWRVIDASSAPHPMHLHGFYFNIQRSGTEAADSALAPFAVSQANTKLMRVGSTMAIRFVPDRPGNWLFHCHLALHVDGESNLGNIVKFKPMSMRDRQPMPMVHGLDAMAGLILGIHVLPVAGDRGDRAVSATEPQNLRLLVQTSQHGYRNSRAIGFVLQNGAEPKRDSVTLPGPTLFLEKGRPARITVVNRLAHPTSVHWHGMEIDSYPDGVPGWSGSPGKLAPAIQPADSFIAEFTPPRAGTFIYHSHVDELMQTNSGMYGALIVTDSTHRFDPAIDKIILVGGGGPGSVEVRSPGMVNGSTNPQLLLYAGTTYRLHIVQIHPQAVVEFQLGVDTAFARWTPVAKDGADLPPQQSTERPAYTLMGAGETAEFLFTPARPGLLKMNIRTLIAGWQVPLVISVRPAKATASN